MSHFALAVTSHGHRNFHRVMANVGFTRRYRRSPVWVVELFKVGEGRWREIMDTARLGRPLEIYCYLERGEMVETRLDTDISDRV